MNFQNIINYIVLFAVLVTGAGYTWAAFKQGKSKKQEEEEKSDISTLGYLRGQIEGLQNLTKQLQEEAKERQTIHNEEMKKMHGQMENLQGQMTQKDVAIQQYTKLFQGSDSDLIKILTALSKTMVNIEGFMSKLDGKVSARAMAEGDSVK